ncbi:MAG: NAD(+)/NADH kinase [Syntrophobacteraceae bacterium]|jgi:NAD+ kinase|nr:NAD(+)/NADH kinase [Syntrophobacteraceae bacterium]
MQHITIIYKRSRSEAAQLAHDLKNWLEARRIRVTCQQNIDDSGAGIRCTLKQLDIPPESECVVVLGGDGTFLSVARFLENRTTSIIGVNLGGLGFLTEISRESCYGELERVLDGQYEIEERMRLVVSVQRQGAEIFRQSVLNDAVINKGALARIVDLRTSIDKRYLTDYRADGLIVATPTGSTAYNLSAGGPIVYPTALAIILTPICSFTLTNRPIILPATAAVEVELPSTIRDLALTCDGQVGCDLAAFDRIEITASPHPLRLIKTPSVDYLEILRTKLKWGLN